MQKLKEKQIKYTHNNELKFQIKSPYVFVWPEGKEFVEEPWIEFVVNGKRDIYPLLINSDDCLPLAMAINRITVRGFDEYDTIKYTVTTWKQCIEEAEKFFLFKTFDDWFDYVITPLKDEKTKKRALSLGWINGVGKNFWDNKEKYRKIVSDVKNWSQIVLKPKDKLWLIGF